MSPSKAGFLAADWLGLQVNLGLRDDRDKGAIFAGDIGLPDAQALAAR